MCSKCFPLAFETCNKANSPLVNRLISDTLVDAKPYFNHTPLQSDKLVLSFQFYKEFQTGK